jgi:hypothetical protein
LCEEATFLPKHSDHEGLCGDAQIYPPAPPCFSLALALPWRSEGWSVFFAEICNRFRGRAKLPNPTNFLPDSLE